MSIYKVPKGVLHDMERFRSKFFQWADLSGEKINLIAVIEFWLLRKMVVSVCPVSMRSIEPYFLSGCGGLSRKMGLSGLASQDLSSKGFDFVSRCKKRVGNGYNTRFWLDIWVLDCPLSISYEMGEVYPDQTNIFIWRARLDRLPTRSNLAKTCGVFRFHLCPICGSVPEDASHFLFQCGLSKLVFRKICLWWDLVPNDMSSFSDWDVWFSGIRLPCKLKLILKGVFYVAWWHICGMCMDHLSSPRPRSETCRSSMDIVFPVAI
ncbi:RNA-directed DNA polymerase, eukaryota [Tanacetum coccineum]